MLNRIQDLCKRKGITIPQIATEMGITTQGLYSSISGNPSLNRLKMIAEYLGVEVYELLAPKEMLERQEPEEPVRLHFQCSCGKVHHITID